MTEQEWLESADARRMLEALWELYRGEELVLIPKLHRYLLACCRRISRILPDEYSRRGVDVAERRFLGKGSREEFRRARWECEGAAFNIDYDCDPPQIQRWVEQTQAIPREELAALLFPPESADRIETRELLKRAAYFAHFACAYSWRRLVRVPDSYSPFLSAKLLREFFGNPFLART